MHEDHNLRKKELQFIEYLSGLSSEDYIFSLISYISAPTLLCGKPATMINFTSSRALYDLWHRYKYEVCNSLKLNYVELRDTGQSVCVLLYKRPNLEACVKRRENALFLQEKGYLYYFSLNDYFKILKERFTEDCPHEIGIFLGFPADDVAGFIRNKGHNYLLCGYWKVYKDMDRAMRIFSIFDKSKEYILDILTGKKVNSPLKCHFERVKLL